MDTFVDPAPKLKRNAAISHDPVLEQAFQSKVEALHARTQDYLEDNKQMEKRCAKMLGECQARAKDLSELGENETAPGSDIIAERASKKQPTNYSDRIVLDDEDRDALMVLVVPVAASKERPQSQIFVPSFVRESSIKKAAVNKIRRLEKKVGTLRNMNDVLNETLDLLSEEFRKLDTKYRQKKYSR